MPGSCNSFRNGDTNRLGGSHTQVPSLVSFALGHVPSLASGHLVTGRGWKRFQLAMLVCPLHLPAGRAISCMAFERHSWLNLDGIRENTTQLDYSKDIRVSSRPTRGQWISPAGICPRRCWQGSPLLLTTLIPRLLSASRKALSQSQVLFYVQAPSCAEELENRTMKTGKKG